MYSLTLNDKVKQKKKIYKTITIPPPYTNLYLRKCNAESQKNVNYERRRKGVDGLPSYSYCSSY